MPLDFASHRINFPSNTGGPRSADHTFEFPSRVMKAESFINGFNIGFANGQHPILRQEINTRAEIDEEDVNVVATFSLRDSSGSFDDPYSGFVDVVVVVNRV